MRHFVFFSWFLLIPLMFHASCLPDSTFISIVPKPVMMKTAAGQFVIRQTTFILVRGTDAGVTRIARFFADRIKFSGGPELQVREEAKEDKNLPAIVFELQAGRSSIHEEGYELKINPK